MQSVIRIPALARVKYAMITCAAVLTRGQYCFVLLATRIVCALQVRTRLIKPQMKLVLDHRLSRGRDERLS